MRASLSARFASTLAVVPVRSTGVDTVPPGSVTGTTPSTVNSTWTLLAASVDLRAAVMIAVGSVRIGPAALPPHAATAMARIASKAAKRVSRRVMGSSKRRFDSVRPS